MWCCSCPSRVCPLPFTPLPGTEFLPHVLSSLFLGSAYAPSGSRELLLCCSSAGCHTRSHENGADVIMVDPTAPSSVERGLDEACCYKETRWLSMHKQAGTRAGNHHRHTRTINVSPPTQAKNATRATNGNPPTRPLYMHLTRTPHTNHTAPCVTKALPTDTAAYHPSWALQGPAQRTHN